MKKGRRTDAKRNTKNEKQTNSEAADTHSNFELMVYRVQNVQLFMFRFLDQALLKVGKNWQEMFIKRLLHVGLFSKAKYVSKTLDGVIVKTLDGVIVNTSQERRVFGDATRLTGDHATFLHKPRYDTYTRILITGMRT